MAFVLVVMCDGMHPLVASDFNFLINEHTPGIKGIMCPV